MRTLVTAVLLALFCLPEAQSTAQPKDPPDLIPPPIDPTAPAPRAKAQPKVAPRAQPKAVKAAPQAARVQPAAPVVSLAGGWSDTDSQEAAKALGSELLQSGVLARFKAKRGRVPAINLQPPRNRSTHHVNLQLFEKTLRQALAGSTSLRLAGGRVGPDLVITGWLHAMDDSAGGTTLQSFLLSLTLFHLETAEKLWIGTHRVRKLVERSQTKQGLQLKVSRRKLDEVIDLSGRFNDTDAASVARAAANDVLGSALVRRGPPCVARFHLLRNRTAEQINTRWLTDQLESLLLRTGKLRAVASIEDAGELRDVRAEAARTASDATVPASGQELGSTCVVTGSISSVSSAEAQGTTTEYTVIFEAVDVDDNRKLWVTRKAIRKVVLRAAPASGTKW